MSAVFARSTTRPVYLRLRKGCGSPTEPTFRANSQAIVWRRHLWKYFGWRARLDGYVMHFSKKSPVWLPAPV
jgi:hypothetical protein